MVKCKKAKKELLNGVHTKKYRDNREYIGSFKNDKRNGWGLMSYSFLENRFMEYDPEMDYPYQNSNLQIYPYPWVVYSGEWKNGEPHGYGKLIFSNNSYCRGEWKKGYITSGEYRYFDGRIYVGNFSEMHYTNLFHITPFKHGYGTMYEKNGKKKCEGLWYSSPCTFSLSSIFEKDKYNDQKEKIMEFGVLHEEK